MKKQIPLLVVLVLLAGCMTVEISTSTDTPVKLTGEAERDFTVVRHFERSEKAWFTLFDLVTMNNPDFSTLIENELQRTPGDAVINIEIKAQTTAIDGLIPITMTVTGTLAGQAIAADPYYGSIHGTNDPAAGA